MIILTCSVADFAGTVVGDQKVCVSRADKFKFCRANFLEHLQRHKIITKMNLIKKASWLVLLLSILIIFNYTRGDDGFRIDVNIFVIALFLVFTISNIYLFFLLKGISTIKNNLKYSLFITLLSILLYSCLIFFYNFLMIYITLAYGLIILVVSLHKLFKK